MHLSVHSSIIYNSQDLETTQVPISKLVDKNAVGHLHNGILHSYQKEGTLTLCNNKDGPRQYYAKPNKTVRER